MTDSPRFDAAREQARALHHLLPQRDCHVPGCRHVTSACRRHHP